MLTALLVHLVENRDLVQVRLLGKLLEEERELERRQGFAAFRGYREPAVKNELVLRNCEPRKADVDLVPTYLIISVKGSDHETSRLDIVRHQCKMLLLIRNYSNLLVELQMHCLR